MDLFGQSACNNNNNPLNQNLILRLVLEHVGKANVTDLKNCRLVNHSWNRVAVHVLEQQHDYSLELDLKNLDEFKNLLWRTQLSRLKSENRELKSLRLSLKLNSLINISVSKTVEFVVGAASELRKAGQMLQFLPHLRVAFIDYNCDTRQDREKGDMEQPQMILVNQELFNVLSLASSTVKIIKILCAYLICPHFEEFDFTSALTFPSLTFLEYRMNSIEKKVGGNEMPDLTKHVVSIIQGAPKLTKLSLYLWDSKVERPERAANSLNAIMKGCADHLEEFELEISFEAKELDAFEALSEIKFPAMRVLRIIDGFYFSNVWFNLFLRNNCPLLDRLLVEWTCVHREEDEPMLLEFPTLPNIINFGFDVVYDTSPDYLERAQTTFSTLMMGLPSLKSFNLSINLLLILGAHLKQSGNLAPSPTIYPVFPNISTLRITADDDDDENDDNNDDDADEENDDGNTTDLLAMTALVYHHTFPNVRQLVIKPRNCGSISMERVGSAMEHLFSYPGIQILEIHDYAEPWLDDLSFANQGFQSLKSLKLFAPNTGKGPRLDPVQLVTRFPALEYLQFGKQMVSANQIQSFRDMLKIFEDPMSK